MIIRIAGAEAVTDESLRKFVKQDKDGFYLDLPDSGRGDDDSDDPGRKKLSEFRENNIKLKKEIDELRRKLDNVDPDALEMGRAALEKARNDRERELIKAGRFDDVFELRMQETRTKHASDLQAMQQKMEASTKAFERMKSSLRESRVSSHILAKAAEHKLQILPSAQSDFIRRALDVYSLDDDNGVVAVDREGNPRFNDDRRPYTELDFFKQVLDEAPHLFAPTKGAPIEGLPTARRGGRFAVDGRDSKAFGQNLADIAAGKVDVKM